MINPWLTVPAADYKIHMEHKLVCITETVRYFTYEGRPWAIIENVVVAREQRGKGFGKKLMTFAINLAEDKGCYKLQLLSGPNEDQVGFYRSLGMQDGTSRGFKKYFVERE
ncbi:MAG: GNAT family N-acetyltransferase [Gemmatimonadetes bacterium]|nr:GNAT family N-acetyltransferase [Gemmatimonadota bacterium]